jgi:hypothetical protein
MSELVPMRDKVDWAERIAQSNLLPKQYQRNPANVLLALEYGTALGISPVVAMQQIHVIEGKPTASAQLIGGLVRNAGHKLRVEFDRKTMTASATIIRSDDPDYEFTAVWTMDRAKAANLTGKGNWRTYPDAMLKARAITEVARDACPEALFGVAYTAEELGSDAPVRVEATLTPPEDVADRFRTACEQAGLYPEAVMEYAKVDEITGDTLPALRDAFKALKDAATNVDTETGEIIDAEVVDEPPIPRSKPPKTAAKLSNAQRAHLMALATRLNWSKEDRLSYGNETLGADLTSWSDLTQDQASELIERMTELATFVDPEGEQQ